MLVVRGLKINQLAGGGMPPAYNSPHWTSKLCNPIANFHPNRASVQFTDSLNQG
jgi:hypothetical protein